MKNMTSGLQAKIDKINRLAEEAKLKWPVDVNRPVKKVTDSLSELIRTPKDAYIFMGELEIARKVAENEGRTGE